MKQIFTPVEPTRFIYPTSAAGAYKELNVSAPFWLPESEASVFEEAFVPTAAARGGGTTLVNLVPEPSAEQPTSTIGLAGTSAVATVTNSGRTQSWPWSGTFSHRWRGSFLTTAGIEPITCGRGNVTDIAIIAGLPYSFSMSLYIASNPGGGTHFRLYFFDNASAVTNPGGTPINSSNAVGTGRFNFKLENQVAPANSVRARIGVRTAWDGVAGNEVADLFTDAWMAVQGTTVPAYFDGDPIDSLTPQGWYGTPHGSPSWKVV